LNSEKKLKKKKRPGNFLYDFVKITGAIPVLLWMRPKIVFLSKRAKRLKGAVLVASNHTSLTDPVLIHCALWKRRLSCLATKDLYRTPLLTFFFEKMHCIQVDKENFSMNSFHAVTDELMHGRAVVIFPEGQVNHDDRAVMTFKSGAMLMAHKAGAPILPVYMKKAHHWYERRKVIVGEPIDTAELLGERPSMRDMNAASAYLRERELELKQYCDDRFGDTEAKEKEKIHN